MCVGNNKSCNIPASGLLPLWWLCVSNQSRNAGHISRQMKVVKATIQQQWKWAASTGIYIILQQSTGLMANNLELDLPYVTIHI